MSFRKRIVVADASVLINLIHVDALQLLGRLVRFEFVVIEHVIQEITRPDQAAALAHAMQQGWIRREGLDRPDGLEAFAGPSSRVLRLHVMTEGHVEKRQLGSGRGIFSRLRACYSLRSGLDCSPLMRQTQ